jgi:hypothetical protein
MPLVHLLDSQRAAELNRSYFGKNKNVQQAIGPAVGPTTDWITTPLLLGRTQLSSKPLVQLLDTSRAGELNRSYWEEQIRPADHWSSRWTQSGLDNYTAPIWKNKFVQQDIGPAAVPIAGWGTKPLLLIRTNLSSRPLVQLLGT